MEQKVRVVCGGIFIGKIREYNNELSLEESIKAAIQYCIENNILRQFLKEHGSEVMNMLTDNLTIDEIAAVRYEEGWEDGREEGRVERAKTIAINLLAKGSTPDFIHEITGLTLETIQRLSD